MGFIAGLLMFALCGHLGAAQKSGIKPSKGSEIKQAASPPAERKAEKKSESAAVSAPKKIKEEVEHAFNQWKEAYAEGDKLKFLQGFAQVPDLTVRISHSEILGYDNYVKAFEGFDIPKTNQPFRDVRILPIDEYAAFVTYLRSTPRPGENGKPLAYRGTVIFAKTYSGWKVLAWHAHVVEEIVPNVTGRD